MRRCWCRRLGVLVSALYTIHLNSYTVGSDSTVMLTWGGRSGVDIDYRCTVRVGSSRAAWEYCRTVHVGGNPAGRNTGNKGGSDAGTGRIGNEAGDQGGTSGNRRYVSIGCNTGASGWHGATTLNRRSGLGIVGNHAVGRRASVPWSSGDESR
jgi:hypothetical protein